MEWFDTFAENLKIFWNQPVPIIGFTVGTIIIGALFIIGKTSIGKKALNKLKALYEDLKSRYENALEMFYTTKNEFDEFKKEKEEEIKQIGETYELKLNAYKERMVKQDEIIKVLCENSPNKKVKDAFANYSPVSLDLPLNEAVESIKEETEKEYESRIAALEVLVYGKKAEETKDTETASE